MRQVKDDELDDMDSIDLSRWTHPTSLKLVLGSNQDRGKWFEKHIAQLVKEQFPEFKDVEHLGTSNPESTGEPDISFINTVSRTKKYIEVKSVREKLKGKNKSINYEVTRLKPFDDGETGNKNFDYLVIAYIHPSMGEIYRSMTHEECVRAIELKIFKFRPDWKGYAFNINDFDSFTHTELKMYKDLECIKHHEQQINKSKNMLDIDNKQVTIKDVISKPLTKEGQEMIGTKMRKPPYSEEISLEQYMSYDENPIQRKTGLRLSGAKKNHLKKFKAPHAVIMVAEYPEWQNKQRVLIDGHTRRACIRDGHFPPMDVPETFLANVFSINNQEQAEALYEMFDNKASVETSSDKNYSVMKSLGYEFQSERFQKPTDLGAVSQLCCDKVGAGDTKEWMRLWKEELMELDSYNIPKGKVKGSPKFLTAPVIAVGLQLINKKFPNVKDFLMKIRDDGGRKSGATKCGVQHLVDWMLTTKLPKAGAEGYAIVAEKTKACFHLYQSGKMQSQTPKLGKKQRELYTTIKTKGQVSS